MNDFSDGTNVTDDLTDLDMMTDFGSDATIDPEASSPLADESGSSTPPLSSFSEQDATETIDPVVSVAPVSDPGTPELEEPELEEYTLSDIYELVTEIRIDDQIYQTQTVQYCKMIVSTTVLIVLALALVAGILLARATWKRM